MTLSTHVLDTEAGTPAGGVPVTVQRFDGPANEWRDVGGGVTDPDGRLADLVTAVDWHPGRWRIVFDTVAVHGPGAFWPRVTVEFVTAGTDHHHVPLLLARHGYSTYRGS